MIQGFLDFIGKEQLFSQTDRLLLAVSGGVDSMVLMHLCKQAGFTFGVAHCNFGLRGEASDQDETFVKKTCELYNIPFFSTRFDTELEAEKNKISIQMAARELRYKWFSTLLENEGYDYLLTAHHKNDLVETILLNLARGTGIAGLHGIQSKQRKIIRPLLFASKEDIVNYGEKTGIVWREDQSNESNKYKRNLVRNAIVPLFKEINPAFEDTLCQSAHKIALAERIVKHQVRAFTEKFVVMKGDVLQISIEGLKQQVEPVWVLYDVLRNYGFSFNDIEDMIDALDAQSGTMFHTSTHRLIKDREMLLLQRNEFSEQKIYTILSADVLELVDVKGIQIKHIDTIPAKEALKKKGLIYLDADKLQYPLVLRPWQAGDWFIPFGMKGRKKISNYLIDRKYSVIEKNDMYVLDVAGDIACIVGDRVDERYKVDADTKKIVVLIHEGITGKV